MNRDTLIMLDLDGTIIDTAALYFQGVPMVLERYLGITIDGNALLPFWGQFAKTIFAHFAKTVGIQDTEGLQADGLGEARKHVVINGREVAFLENRIEIHLKFL